MATDVLAGQEQRVAELTDQLVSQYPPSSTHAVEFLGAQYDMGLAWVHFPVGSGGLDVSPKFQKIVNEKIARAGGPSSYARNPIGYGMCGPTVVDWGTAEQKDRYLRPLFTGEEIWCQLFSEPGSGSDFAGLSAKGVRDGEEWISNGQKVWTTLAHLSKWGLLVVRTDADAVKHAGLTAVVVDMQAQGVEVRPLRQMTGEAEFNEVYFTDPRVPVSETLGNVGDGSDKSVVTRPHALAQPAVGSGPKKPMRSCPKCRAEMSAAFRICPKCKLYQPDKLATTAAIPRHCPLCGQPSLPAATQGTGCGGVFKAA